MKNWVPVKVPNCLESRPSLLKGLRSSYILFCHILDFGAQLQKRWQMQLYAATFIKCSQYWKSCFYSEATAEQSNFNTVMRSWVERKYLFILLVMYQPTSVAIVRINQISDLCIQQEFCLLLFKNQSL